MRYCLRCRAPWLYCSSAQVIERTAYFSIWTPMRPTGDTWRGFGGFRQCKSVAAGAAAGVKAGSWRRGSGQVSSNAAPGEIFSSVVNVFRGCRLEPSVRRETSLRILFRQHSTKWPSALPEPKFHVIQTLSARAHCVFGLVVASAEVPTVCLSWLEFQATRQIEDISSAYEVG